MHGTQVRRSAAEGTAGIPRYRKGVRVRAVLKRPDGSHEICEAAYLAGCDGAHSTVREALATGFPGGTYSGLF